MPGSTEYRSATPLISAIRNFLRGREILDSLRHADRLATRSPPHPRIPGGPYHKTSKMYYFTRDARREVPPPEEVYVAKQLAEGETQSKDTLQLTAPAEVYNPK